jgi:hypothetical protein
VALGCRKRVVRGGGISYCWLFRIGGPHLISEAGLGDGCCWKLRHTQYSSHWNDGFGATDRVSCIDLSKFYSSGDPPFRGVSPSPVFTAVV